MQRRGGSGLPAKEQRKSRPKARKAPIAHVSNADLQEQLGRAMRERDEALERQAATFEVLQVISASPGKLEPVFQAMLENALRICEAKFGTLFRFDGKAFHRAAGIGVPSALAELQEKRGPYLPESGTLLDRVLQTREVAHSPDYAAEPIPGNAAKLGGARSTVAVPMLKDSELVGAIIIYRQEVRPFTDKQIELVQNFAAQAVIAIENTRLLSELHQRTNDLSESLEQQTATSEVLKVISSSPGKLEPVFDAMLANATRICEAKIGVLYLGDENSLHAVAATHDAPPAYVEARKQSGKNFPLDGPIRRAASTKQVAHVTDIRELQSYLERHPMTVVSVELGKFRTVLAVPMLKDDELIGVITLNRQEVRPFTDKQIELVKNFAAQAVIAIENARLLGELRQRTDDLSESLEQQTATSKVLGVISSSPGELKPVFQSMLENAVRICEASFGNLLLYENDAFRHVALHNAPQAWATEQQRDPVAPRRSARFLYHVAETKQVSHIADITAENPDEPIAKAAGARTLLIVPMLKENELIGAIAIYRQEVRPFTDKQIELVKNFAAQAVIAIENTRLLNELRESLQQQTATSDVLKVISSSLNDLQPVFETIGQRAEKLCDAEISVISMVDGNRIRLVSINGVTEEGVEAVRQVYPMRRDAETVTARTIRSAAICHIPDVLADALYQTKDAARVSGFRGSLGVPMIRDGQVIGAIFVARRQPGLFTEAQVQLLKTFADQAVIAIENVRLFNETKEALAQQTATADVLKVISSSRGELNPVFNAMLENAVRICSAKFGNLMLLEGDAFRTVALHGAPSAYAEARRREPLTRHRPGTVLGQVLATKRPAQIADVQAEPAYYEDPSRVNFLKLAGARTVVAVPMLRENELVGAIFIYRQEVQQFTEKQIELLENFAAQAVIAIENTRLLNELRESLQQQTATADVLKLISRSTFDLRTVLQTLIESAARFCDADKASVIRERNAGFYSAEAYGYSREFMDYVRDIPIKAERGTARARAPRRPSGSHR